MSRSPVRGLGAAVAAAAIGVTAGGVAAIFVACSAPQPLARDTSLGPPVPEADAATSGDAGRSGVTDEAGPGGPGEDAGGGDDAVSAGDADEERQPGSDDGGDADGDAAAAADPRCSLDHVWQPFGRVAVVPSTFDRFGGVSADELSIAWSAGGIVYVADRAVRSAAFGAAVALPATPAIAAGDRVALSPAGTTVVAAAAGGRAFVVFGRATRSDPWGAAASLPFSAVNAMASGEGGGRFSEPVLAADGRSFYFVFQALGQGADAPPGAPALFESRWDDPSHAWAPATALANPELAGTAGLPARATGASSDGRTLFFVDPASATERGAWRTAPSTAFAAFRSAAGFLEAAPNERCDTLYFVGADDAGAGVFLAQ